MNRALRVAIVHRNRLFRECLGSVLGNDDLHVFEVDHGCPEHLTALVQAGNDVVLIDLNLPDRLALQLMRQLREQGLETKVILVVSAAAPETLVAVADAGAHGCFLEEASLAELKAAIASVSQGQAFCSPQIAHFLLGQLAQLSRQAEWRQRIDSVNLTPREMEVLALLAERLSNKQIAKKLAVSVYTVKNHVHSILGKLQVEDRAAAVESAREHHWLTPREHPRIAPEQWDRPEPIGLAPS